MRTLATIFVAAAVAGCASSPPAPAPSYVSSGSLAGAIGGATAIGLAVGSGVDDDPGIDAASVEEALRQAIIEEVTRRGYTLVPPPRAERLIAYVAIVDYGDEDAALFERLGMSPGVGRGELIERGTVGLFVQRPGVNEPLWRAAAQGALDPRASDRARSDRVRAVVQTLLADLPPAR